MRLCLTLFLIACIPLMGYTQPIQFTKDSIPIVDGKVVFSVNFEYDLDKEEFHKRAFAYLNNTLDPYSGKFHLNNDDYTVSRITDYLVIDESFFQTLGMYMTYTLQLEYKDGSCMMVIRDITYMEKGYFEAQEASERKLNMPTYSGKDIMIDEKYALMLKKNTSEKITDESLKRINEIIKTLDVSFAK